MNYDQLGGILRVLLASFAVYAAKKGWIPAMDKETFASDLFVLISTGAIAAWSHISHRAVAPTIAPIAALFALLCFSGDARSADVATKAVPAAQTGGCITEATCSGWYAYGGIGGTGTSVDVIGSGLQNSVFSNGAEMMLGGGYQLWNGKYFAAIEAGGGFLIPANGQAVALQSRLKGETLIKAGYGLQGLFTTSAAPTTLDALAQNVISPYGIIGGVYRNFGTGFATGAGLEYWLAKNTTLAVEYLHVNYSGAVDHGVPVNDDNSIRLLFAKHFELTR